MSKIEHDRSYWPEGGTAVPTIPADLNTLWDSHPDQAQTFIAESLINGDAMNARFCCEDCSLIVYLWTVGGDTLTVSYDLIDELEHAAPEYLVRSQAQADEVSEALQGLQRLEDAIRVAKSKLENKLTEFRNGEPCTTT